MNSKQEQTLSPPSLLVVDDNLDFLHVCEAMLSEMGYPIITASSIELALSKLQENSVDIVILDYHVGPTTGDTLVSRARKINPDLKFIGVTAAFDPIVTRAFNRQRVTAIASKPVDFEVLRKLIEKFQKTREQNKVAPSNQNSEFQPLKPLWRLKRRVFRPIPLLFIGFTLFVFLVIPILNYSNSSNQGISGILEKVVLSVTGFLSPESKDKVDQKLK